jgi:HEAT repeat protein
MKNFDSTTKFVEFYLEKLRRGEFEMAFHGLTEGGRPVIPHLIKAFRNERSPDIRAELVNIVWNHRQPETVNFLAEALNDLDQKVWKSALDGLVTIASSAALQILQTASNKEFPNERQTEEFRKWLNEAITQIQEVKAQQPKNI